MLLLPSIENTLSALLIGTFAAALSVLYTTKPKYNFVG